MDDSVLEARYRDLCRTPSDIFEHLPFFLQLTVDLGAQKIIELGTRDAVSTHAWCLGACRTGGHVWSVDLTEPPLNIDLPRWTFLQGHDLSPAVFSELPDDADIVFIDTSHAYDQTRAELNLYQWKVRPGGKMILHDTELARPFGISRGERRYPVKAAIEDFCADEGLTWENRPNCFGLGIIEVPEEKPA